MFSSHIPTVDQQTPINHALDRSASDDAPHDRLPAPGVQADTPIKRQSGNLPQPPCPPAKPSRVSDQTPNDSLPASGTHRTAPTQRQSGNPPESPYPRVEFVFVDPTPKHQLETVIEPESIDPPGLSHPPVEFHFVHMAPHDNKPAPGVQETQTTEHQSVDSTRSSPLSIRFGQIRTPENPPGPLVPYVPHALASAH